MRAFHVVGTTFDDLNPVQLPDPQPAAGEVLVRLRAASLNYRDLALLRGTYAPRPQRPWIPLSDGAGEVAGTGAAVTRVRPGDRVVLHYVRDWVAGEPTAETMRARLGGPLDGTLAELIAVPEHAVVPLPEGVSIEDAATLPVAGTAAWHALFDFACVKPGDTVVVQGTGGVSMFALQLARAAGARTLLTTRSAAKAAGLGADEVIDTSSAPAWDERVLALTAGRGADLVVDVAGGAALSRSMRATRVGGKVALIGFLDGMQAPIDLPLVIQRRLDLRGVSVGPRSSLEALVRAFATRALRPVIARSFGFGDARKAFEQQARADAPGKVLVRIA